MLIGMPVHERKTRERAGISVSRLTKSASVSQELSGARSNTRVWFWIFTVTQMVWRLVFGLVWVAGMLPGSSASSMGGGASGGTGGGGGGGGWPPRVSVLVSVSSRILDDLILLCDLVVW
jgi:hypothetical protein